MADHDVDLFVIGAGSGGVRTARMCAQQGLRVMVAESQYLGGTCVNVGCVPKKLFVYASSFREEFRTAKGFRWVNQVSTGQHFGTIKIVKSSGLMISTATYLIRPAWSWLRVGPKSSVQIVLK